MSKKSTFFGFFALLPFFWVVSCGVELGIPEKKMASILVDFYLADGVMLSHQDSYMHELSDSAQIYTPILRKHGYTPEDFRNSLKLYMKNPRALDNVYSNAMKQLVELKKQYSSVAEALEKEQEYLEEEAMDLDDKAQGAEGLPKGLYYEASIAGDTARIYW